MGFEFHLGSLINALIYAVMGVVILVVSFIVWDKITPYDLWKEIVEKQNTALAIFAGLMALGIAIIVASAVH
jgi:putative membrane protein